MKLPTFSALACLLCCAGEATAGILYVDPSGMTTGNQPAYTTIQGAVNAAAPGTTITVDAASYAENVVISQSNITLAGAQGGVNPVGGRSGPESILNGTITITGANVTVNGFTVNANSQWAIQIGGPSAPSTDGTFGLIEDNIVTNSLYYGIQVGPSYQQTPLNTVVQNNVVDVAATGAGIYVFTTASITVQGNSVGGGLAGIDNYYSYNDSILSNTLMNTSLTAIRLRGSHGNVVEYNSGSGNGQPDIQEGEGSYGNTILFNFENFVSPPSVPEPSTLLLAILGTGCLCRCARKCFEGER